MTDKWLKGCRVRKVLVLFLIPPVPSGLNREFVMSFSCMDYSQHFKEYKEILNCLYCQ